MLTLHHAELKSGGRFCLDVLLQCHVPKESVWKQLNEVVSDFVKSGRIKVEERQKIALRSFERDDDVINTAMGRHEKNFKIVVKEKVNSRFTAWGEYEKHKDPARLSKDYTAWLKEWTAGALMMTLGASRAQEEKTAIITEIYTELEARCARLAVSLDVALYDFILEKI